MCKGVGPTSCVAIWLNQCISDIHLMSRAHNGMAVSGAHD